MLREVLTKIDSVLAEVRVATEQQGTMLREMSAMDENMKNLRIDFDEHIFETHTGEPT